MEKNKVKREKFILKVDRTGGGIRDYTNQLFKSQNNFFVKSEKLRIEQKNSQIIYQVGNSSRRILLDFLINNKSRRIIELHDSLARNRVLRAIYPSMMHYFLKRADKIILHSEHSRKFFKKTYGSRYNKKIIIIPHLIFKVRGEKEKITKGIKFLFTGQIKKSKGLFFIMKAFSELPTQYKKRAFLIIAGNISKEIFGEIKRYNLENIILINKHLSEQELNNLIYSSDFIFNFKIEDLGESSGIVSRAIALNKIVIPSRIGLNVEYFNRSTLMSNVDVNSLRKKIIYAIKNKNKVISEELKNIKILRSNFSAKEILKKYKKIKL